jgi:hypothetical protein
VGLGMGTGILCIFVCVIFKTGKSCGFGYVLVESFSKLENITKKMVWVLMWVWVLLCWCGCLEPSHLSKSGEKIIFLRYALAASFSTQDNHANTGLR